MISNGTCEGNRACDIKPTKLSSSRPHLSNSQIPRLLVVGHCAVSACVFSPAMVFFYLVAPKISCVRYRASPRWYPSLELSASGQRSARRRTG
ncbi:hypothetical protein BD309DRAFT_27335 [Dichomitus squalens]|nr:hypothetical protein BD309DRAFT_27335 [Dichomitus squalens]